MQKTVQDYDASLLWSITEPRKCNLNCIYCFHYAPPGAAKPETPKEKPIPKIDIPALLKSLNGTNKVFLVKFAGGGEPFLVPNLIEAFTKITKRHYIMLISNITSIKIRKFADTIDPCRVTYIHASLHIKELERLNLTGRYIENFLACRKRGFRIYAAAISYPPLCSEALKYKKFFEGYGIDIVFTPFIGKYNERPYPQSYSEEELAVFGLKKSDQEMFRQSGKVCNAGYNTAMVGPDGAIYPCEMIKETISNIYQKIEFRDNLIVCPFDFCGCPLNAYDPYLFEKALKEKWK